MDILLNYQLNNIQYGISFPYHAAICQIYQDQALNYDRYSRILVEMRNNTSFSFYTNEQITFVPHTQTYSRKNSAKTNKLYKLR